MSVAGPFGCRCLSSRPMLRFHAPLFKPDGRFSRIRLSDKESRFRPRMVARSLGEPDKSQLPIEIAVGESCYPSTLELVLPTQPLAQPDSGVVVHAPVGLAYRPPRWK